MRRGRPVRVDGEGDKGSHLDKYAQMRRGRPTARKPPPEPKER